MILAQVASLVDSQDKAAFQQYLQIMPGGRPECRQGLETRVSSGGCQMLGTYSWGKEPAAGVMHTNPYPELQVKQNGFKVINTLSSIYGKKAY